jgi:glycosyltransferase involved in cell wall biosynthesis
LVPTVSVIVPTHNRAQLWRNGWLLAGLRAIAAPETEIIIVDDHSTDDTLDFLRATFARLKLPSSVTLAQCLSPPTRVNRASAAPDQVGFGLARAPLILHLDDDLRIHPGLLNFLSEINLSRTVLWLQNQFVDTNGLILPGHRGRDSRLPFARGHSIIAPLCPRRQLHWGGGFAVPTTEILAIGGHTLELRGFRNSDTRLGTRLIGAGLRSLLALDPRGIVDHFGPTWYRSHLRDTAAVNESRRAPRGEPVTANGGRAYFNSPDFAASFSTVAQFP